MLMVKRSCLVLGTIDPVGGNLCEVNERVFSKEFLTSDEATIFQNQPKISAGKGLFLVGMTRNGERRSLLKFPVWGFPSDAKIVCAEIRLYASVTNEDRGKIAVPRTRLYQMTLDWTSGENVLNSINGGFVQTGDTTWTYSNFPKRKWLTPGGDFNSEKILSTVTLEDDLHWFGATPEMNDLVQMWISGHQKNYGVIMISDEEDISYSFYHGFDNSPEFIPRLIVTYTSPKDGKAHLPKVYKREADPVPNTNSSDDGGRISSIFYIVAAFSCAVFVVFVLIGLRYHRRKRAKSQHSQCTTDASVV